MTININGKDYDEKTFSEKLKSYLIARQEIQQNKSRIMIELEKIEVLTNYYDSKISEELKLDTK